MSTWHTIAARIAHILEAGVDAFQYSVLARLTRGNQIVIVPYRGYGTPQCLYLRGRVLQDSGITPARETDSIWRNLLNMYRRFESDEVPGARLMARFQEATDEVLTNDEGYFEVQLRPAHPPAQGKVWHEVALTLIDPPQRGPNSAMPVNARGRVLVPPANAQFGVISDIDDTVVRSQATDVLRMFRIVFLGNAFTRLPFKGVAAFYRALQAGADDAVTNPIFYVSSSPWNLYDLLQEFFKLRDIPLGPIALRDYGIRRHEMLPIEHRDHKLGAIRRILDTYPDLPFILIGDSGQEDPEIYRDIVDAYSERILAVYIRSVHPDPTRVDAVNRLADEIADAGSTLVLADNTLVTARHAANQGWITPDALSKIREDMRHGMTSIDRIGTLFGQKQTEV